MSYWKQNRGFLIFMGLVIALIVTLFYVGLQDQAIANATATTAPVSNPERVEIFMAGAGDDGRAELKQKLNAWLKERGSFVDITGRTMACGDRFIIASIWYKEH